MNYDKCYYKLLIKSEFVFYTTLELKPYIRHNLSLYILPYYL